MMVDWSAMPEQKVREIYSRDQKRRLIIFRREAGATFYFLEEAFSDDLLEMCWVPSVQNLTGVYESAETAMRAARAKVSWLGTATADQAE